ncbi:response regulator [Massilia timonae]|uniref:Sensory box protein n=1 Tax=Massilia timonae TaxID=47229 RepID=A0A1S2NES7_9BURK|nr:response regulator [Massilia timonae]OIJ43479.1 sensory box protein [Massilia timonae]
MLIPQARVAPAANQEAPAVLLVNDDPGALFALRSVLGDLDADLVTASSGEQALLRLLKQDFCVILMDVKMAGLDGFETARLVRARPRSRATPIVFLTSHRASDLDRSRGFEVGASDYMFMPVAPEVLKAKVQAFLDDAPERRPVRALAPGAHGEAPDAGIERLILEHAGDYVALLDPSGAWLYTSPSYRAEFGAAVGPGARYLEIVQVDDRERVRALVEHPPAGESHWRLQYRVLGRSERYFESDASLIRAPNGAVSQLVLISRDITERKEMEATCCTSPSTTA